MNKNRSSFLKRIKTEPSPSRHDPFPFSLKEEIEAVFPIIQNAYLLLSNPPKLARIIIENILRIGHKLVLSGSSKAGKSFMLICMALTLATGREWFGLKCAKCRVLYVNCEVDHASFIARLSAVANALLIPYSELCQLQIITLRGINMHSADMLNRFIKHIGKEWDAIILDPMYKLYPIESGFKENDAEGLILLLSKIDELIASSGAAIIMCTHTTKGAQGHKAAVDRASGSGVWARDPDAILSLIETDDHDDGFKLEFVLREFPPISPMGIRYQYPIHIRDNKLDDCTLRGAKGAKKRYTSDTLLQTWMAHADKTGFVSIETLENTMGGSWATWNRLVKYLKDNKQNRYNLHMKKDGLYGDLSKISN